MLAVFQQLSFLARPFSIFDFSYPRGRSVKIAILSEELSQESESDDE
jgi:hypothetical protein